MQGIRQLWPIGQNWRIKNLLRMFHVAKIHTPWGKFLWGFHDIFLWDSADVKRFAIVMD